jgi:hypothetical protein
MNATSAMTKGSGDASRARSTVRRDAGKNRRG